MMGKMRNKRRKYPHIKVFIIEDKIGTDAFSYICRRAEKAMEKHKVSKEVADTFITEYRKCIDVQEILMLVDDWFNLKVR